MHNVQRQNQQHNNHVIQNHVPLRLHQTVSKHTNEKNESDENVTKHVDDENKQDQWCVPIANEKQLKMIFVHEKNQKQNNNVIRKSV